MLRTFIWMCAAAIVAAFGFAQEAASPFDAAIDEAKANMMAAPDAAHAAALRAETLAADTPSRADDVTSLWLQGEALNRMNRPHDAVPVLEAAIGALPDTVTGTKLQADLLVARAGSAGALGDYGVALTNFQAAHDIFLELGEDRSRAMALMNVANIYADARNHERAIDYYRLAGEAYGGDAQFDLARLNNIATAQREAGDYDAAEAGFREALAIAVEMDSAMLQARILTNVAAAQLEQGAYEAAARSIDQGFALERAQSSGWEPFLYGMQARIAFVQGDTQTAADQISQMFTGLDLATTPVPFMEFHDVAQQIYDANAQTDLALQHLQAFKRLDDERRDISAAANTALLGAEFDFANQELQISRLRTETLEQEVALRATRARQRFILFAGSFGVLLILLAGGGYHYAGMRKSRNDVREANTKLSDSNKSLEKALKAKSEFLATTSHEIRTPLNAILGMTQLLSHQRDLNTETRERVDLVQSSGEAMKAIVDDILDMSKIESGTVTVDQATCEVARVLEMSAQTWIDAASAKNLALNINIENCPVAATTDERKLRQISLNLLSNAVKFTATGEVSLDAFSETTEAGDMLVVRVTDTGCGIPADQLDAIFEPFHQVDSSATRQFSGTGLGLAISQELARALGGDITVESQEGVGSVFTCQLPISDIVQPSTDMPTAPTAVDLLVVVSNPLHEVLAEAFLEDDPRSVSIIDDLDSDLITAPGFSADMIILSCDALGDDPVTITTALQTLSDRFEQSRLRVWVGEDCDVPDALLRLSGADDVISGPFNPIEIFAHDTPSTELGNQQLASREPQ